MASYTMQLQEYIEAQCQDHTCYSSRERIELGRKALFDFDYPIFDESYRKILETHFIRFFYSREIGFETEGLFKFNLETWMIINMPYYNKLFESELIKYNPLHNTVLDTTHNRKNDKNQKDIRDTVQDTKSDSKTSLKGHSESNQENQQTGSGTRESDNFERKLLSNTPDSRLNITTKDGEGVIEYANKIEEENENNKDKTTSTNKGTGKETGDSKEDGTANTTANAKQNDQLKSDINELEDFVEHKVGKLGTQNYPEMIEAFRGTFLRLENRMFDEMQQLFMGVY